MTAWLTSDAGAASAAEEPFGMGLMALDSGLCSKQKTCVQLIEAHIVIQAATKKKAHTKLIVEDGQDATEAVQIDGALSGRVGVCGRVTGAARHHHNSLENLTSMSMHMSEAKDENQRMEKESNMYGGGDVPMLTAPGLGKCEERFRNPWQIAQKFEMASSRPAYYWHLEFANSV
jgi:hypothetical protein